MGETAEKRKNKKGETMLVNLDFIKPEKLECLTKFDNSEGGLSVSFDYDGKKYDVTLAVKDENNRGGVYYCSGNFEHTINDYTKYKCDYLDDLNHYGVCDNVEQILKAHPEILTSPELFVISLTGVYRKDQSSWGGWRWHKWGEYIGDYEIQNEYLYDEDIDIVICYHVFHLQEK